MFSLNSSATVGEQKTAAKTKPKYIRLLPHVRQGSCTHMHTHQCSLNALYEQEHTHNHSDPQLHKHIQTFPSYADKKLAVIKQIVALSFTFRLFCPHLVQIPNVCWLTVLR